MKSPITNQASLPLWKTRAPWLALIPVLMILCLAAAPQSQSKPGYIHNNAPQLEGSWVVTVSFPDGTSLPVKPLVTFSAGGTMMGSDPSPFPTYFKNTPQHGTWARKGPREFVFTAIGYQYGDVDDGDPDGLYTIVVKETVAIERGGESYNGTGTVQMFDPEGNLLWSLPDTTRAVRIKPE